ncbi:hypothetical protein MYCTH_2306212 [Thermothelomyces thermophilus ATCC 42464]|uniref:Cytochrome P450 monooxygenase ABA1 n=1 Tax=Thermothelomyces thermophilus (strain ATCC 42464 / BCRC 31852 / DSM 1799) TaxID=573729 RepID=G2QH53_THET4|nr:uncharacterized protein MYCTH_2306212 [Thermothelomyces thermophilus ATCC 42464]AEO58713.1 hypothetical protein MYCTH_2306212 [Thermothelomyces thermophilus ATCC 42464]
MLPEAFSFIPGPYQVPALASLLLFVFLVIWYGLSWRRLSHIPGPPLASLSYLWMLRIARSGEQSARYAHINAKYGSLARIGPNELIIDDPAVVRRMNAARSPYRRSSWYSAMRLDPYQEDLFSMADTAEHDLLRAKMSFGFGGKELPDVEGDIDAQVDLLVHLIRSKYLSDENGVTCPFDMAITAQYFTMDVITKLVFGKQLGFLETDSDVYNLIHSSEGPLQLQVLKSEMPLIGRIFSQPWVLKNLGPKKTNAGGLGRILGTAEEVVAKRFRHDAKDEMDMMGSFIRHGVTQQQCEVNTPFILVAGSDTTASAIRGTMLHLATTRHAYNKLRDEIDRAVAEGRISSPVTVEEAMKLEYLQAVIYEGIRVQIPFSGLLMKEVPPEGDTINGVFVPGGSRIAHNTLAIMRRPEIFGQDVDVFRPERWLGVSPEQKQLMVQTTELVFGYGRWSCLGKPVAFIELNKVFVELLRRFDFEILYPKRPWRELNFNIFYHSELWMRVTGRH